MHPGSVLELAAAGRAAWPDLSLGQDAFVAEIERRLAAASDVKSAIDRTRPDDLYLACACARGDHAAIRAFESRYAKVIDRVVNRFGRTSDKRDELRQLLRERLFVAAEGREPRIASYTGQGFLENWLRVAAVRAFMNADRAKNPAAAGAEDEALSALADGHDLELGFLKVHYRSAFRAAFGRAVARLSSSDRLIIKLSVLESLSCDDLAVTLGVHRATAARRTARARQTLVDATKSELAESLRVEPNELASILQLVESNLDLSLSRLLDASRGAES